MSKEKLTITKCVRDTIKYEGVTLLYYIIQVAGLFKGVTSMLIGSIPYSVM